MSKAIVKKYRTSRENLSYIKNLLEGYDNLAIMTTVDAKEGIFEIRSPSGMSGELTSIMEGLGREVHFCDG